jgi:hypothetical protein
MAGRRFNVADVVEVLQHWQAGRSVRQLASSLGMGRGRVRQIVAAAAASGVRPSDPALTRPEWEARLPELFPERVAGGVSDQRRQLARFHAAIVEGLKTNTAQTVWQRLHDERGLEVSVATFRRYVHAHVQGVRPELVTVRKEVTPPGEVAEVDYGRLGLWVDPLTGRRRTINGFVMTLAFSRHLFVDAVDCCDQASWVRSHVDAFEFFGAAPRVLRLDNLKTGVLRADIYDPQINRAFAEMAEHYGVLVDPCRQGRPKDKPRVERAVPYARDSYWRGRDFEERAEMREGARRWCTEVAGRRPHRTLPGTVLEIFGRVEQPAMLSLPPNPFEIAHWATAKLHVDCHVQVRGRFYSVPWRHVGKQLDVRVGERVVRIYDGGVLLKTHPLIPGARRYTDPADLPEEKVAFLQRTPAWCRRRAGELGAGVAMLVDALLAEPPHPLCCLRQVQAVLRLHDTYGASRLDAACQLALVADGSYRTVKNILANGLDRHDEDDAHVSNAGAFLHGQQVLLGEATL